MAAYSNERVAAIVVSVLYRMLTYNSSSSILHNVSCGTKVNGGPEAKIIFNATFSNRKKILNQ